MQTWKRNYKFKSTAEWLDSLKIMMDPINAGHGKPGENFGHLELFGRDTNKRARNNIVWNMTEKLLKPADADVLEIFDCSFEYLAATKPMDPTELPGERSFTSALIWSLEKLVQEKPQGRFTTKELLDEIRTKAPNFPKDQIPQLSDRDNTKCPAGRIMLNPLEAYQAVSEKSGQAVATEPADGHVVTLHFEFGKKPLENLLRNLGERFNELFERNTFAVHRVRWSGMKRTMFALAARRFQAPIRKRRASGKGRPIPHAKHTTPRSPSMVKLDTKLLSPQAAGFETQDSMDVESPGSYIASTAPTSDMEKD
ncbi:MAG: hypothetical protein Q9181_007006 [Wetmoreana brouardii]